MKYLVSFACAIAVIISLGAEQSAASVQVGDTLKLVNGPGSPGGVFKADSTASPDAWPVFPTFCVELHEYINFSSTYVVDSIALSTDASDSSKNKTLTAKAAWLYSSFLDGTLGLGFDGGKLNEIDDANGSKLQLAIWTAMGYTGGFAGSDISTYVGGSWYDMYNDATLFATWDTAFANSGWAGVGDVRIMNLRTLSGGYAQDQLVRIPPPPPGGGDVAPEPTSFLVWTLVVGCVGFCRRLAS